MTVAAVAFASVPLTVSISVTGDRTVIVFDGEADLVTEPVFRGALDEVLAGDTGSIVVDLTRVTFCDVRCLALLASSWSRATERGVGFALAGMSDQLHRIWRLLYPAVPLPR